MTEGFRRIGEGNTADIFLIDDKKVLKLFKSGYSQDAVLKEYRNHCLVGELTDSVPRVYDFMEADGRYGYSMENVKGVSLASFMLRQQSFAQAMERFVRIHKDWLSMRCGRAVLYKDWMKNVLRGKAADKALFDRIEGLPDGDILCHGDFHPYNILITEEDRHVVIDFANICRGPREYDIARTYFLLKSAKADMPVAEIYLEKMEIPYIDIQAYVETLAWFREYEMKT